MIQQARILRRVLIASITFIIIHRSSENINAHQTYDSSCEAYAEVDLVILFSSYHPLNATISQASNPWLHLMEILLDGWKFC